MLYTAIRYIRAHTCISHRSCFVVGIKSPVPWIFFIRVWIFVQITCWLSLSTCNWYFGSQAGAGHVWLCTCTCYESNMGEVIKFSCVRLPYSHQLSQYIDWTSPQLNEGGNSHISLCMGSDSHMVRSIGMNHNYEPGFSCRYSFMSITRRRHSVHIPCKSLTGGW